MKLKLLLGRAGTGKTRRILREMAALEAADPWGRPLLLLVPEQATYQMERDLLDALHERGRRGAQRSLVVSFTRLAWWFMKEEAWAPRPSLGEAGGVMALQAFLLRHQKELLYFGPVARKPGLARTLWRSLQELESQGIGPEELERVEGVAGDLEAKLRDMALLMREYRLHLGQRKDEPDALTQMARILPQSRALQGVRLFVDGFSHFYEAQWQLLRALLQTAEEVTVALTVDPRAPDEPLFAHPRRTWKRLLEEAREGGIPVEEVALGEPLRFEAQGLRHLERELFSFPGERHPGPVSELVLWSARHRRHEVLALAGEVERLVREEGLRYRDVAVWVRDLDLYRHDLASVFRSRDIPFFIDRRRPVPHHPLLQLILAALEAVAGGFPPETIYRYLKSDLLSLPRDKADRLENYGLAMGARGSHWKSRSPSFPDPEMEGLRQQALGPLFRLEDAFRPSQASLARDYGEALLAFLEELEVPQRLEAWSAEAEGEGRLDEAQEHLQVWDQVMDVLEQASLALGDLSLSPTLYHRMLREGLGVIDVGLVPPTLDQVVIGTAERSRPGPIRVLFLLGVTEDAYPRPAEEDVIFSDAERELLLEKGLDLGKTSALRMEEEAFLTYVAFTRASHRLYVSYPRRSEEGKRLHPSTWIRRLKVLFPRLEEREPPDHLPFTRPQMAAYLAQRVRQELDGEKPLEARERALWSSFQRDEEGRRLLEPYLWALRYQREEAALVGEDLRLLLGKEPIFSVSQLETYAACSFRYLSHYILGLKERPLARMDPARLGEVFHRGLLHLSRRLAEEGCLEEEALPDLLDAILADMEHRIPEVRRSYVRRQLVRILGEVGRHLQEHLAYGRFRPSGLEKPFRFPLLLPDGTRAFLEGRIDRVEECSTEEATWVRVVDYKTWGKSLDLEEVRLGLSLQLPLYLLAAVELWGGEPAGFLYMPILLRWKERPPSLKMDGYLVDHPDALLAMDERGSGRLIPASQVQKGGWSKQSKILPLEDLRALMEKALKHAQTWSQAILEGRVKEEPLYWNGRLACENCIFQGFCHYDPFLPGFQPRRPRKGEGEHP